MVCHMYKRSQMVTDIYVTHIHSVAYGMPYSTNAYSVSLIIQLTGRFLCQNTWMVDIWVNHVAMKKKGRSKRQYKSPLSV